MNTCSRLAPASYDRFQICASSESAHGHDTNHLEVNGSCQLGNYASTTVIRQRLKSPFLHS